MSAYQEMQSEQWQRALSARTIWAMARHSDQSDAATRIMEAQAARLRRLRDHIETIGEAAELSGISRDAWGRMERAEAKIDAVALARWCDHHELSPAYVITGELCGLPKPLARELLQLELAEAAAAEGTEAAPVAAPSGRTKRKSTYGSAKRPVRAE